MPWNLYELTHFFFGVFLTDKENHPWRNNVLPWNRSPDSSERPKVSLATLRSAWCTINRINISQMIRAKLLGPRDRFAAWLHIPRKVILGRLLLGKELPVKMKYVRLVYFFGVCWIFPILVPIFLIDFLRLGIKFDNNFFEAFRFYFSVYFWSGLVLLIIDLWLSDLPKDKKIFWMILGLFFVPSLPIYWYKYLLKEATSYPFCKSENDVNS